MPARGRTLRARDKISHRDTQPSRMKIRLFIWTALATALAGLVVLKPSSSRTETPAQQVKPSAVKTPRLVMRSETSDTLSPLLEELRRAVASEDAKQISDALRGLIDYSLEHPDEFNRLTLAMANDDVLAAKIGLLFNLSPPNGNTLVTRVALLLVQPETESEHRLAALSALGGASEISADALRAIPPLCVDDLNGQIRHSAVATMSEWMTRNSNPSIHDFLSDQLIWIVGSSVDAEVRAQAVQTLARNNSQLPGKVRDALLNYLQTVPTPRSRMSIALALGGEADAGRAFALDQLQQACAEASDVELKRNILFEIVRLGKLNASQIIAQLSASNPALAQDTQDYLALLQSGVTDPDAIYDTKSAWDAERGTRMVLEQTNPVPAQQ
jgi:hypothetical protein